MNSHFELKIQHIHLIRTVKQQVSVNKQIIYGNCKEPENFSQINPIIFYVAPLDQHYQNAPFGKKNNKKCICVELCAFKVDTFFHPASRQAVVLGVIRQLIPNPRLPWTVFGKS